MIFVLIFSLLFSCNSSFNFRNLKNKITREELTQAINQSNMDLVVNSLNDNFILNKKDDVTGYYPIHEIILSNNIELFKIFLNKKLNLLVIFGKNRLNIADFVAKYGCLDQVNILSSHTIFTLNSLKNAYENEREDKLNIIDKIYKIREANEIHRCCFEGNKELLIEILKRKKEIKKKDKEHLEAIHYAIFGNKKECLKKLIEEDFDILSTDYEGKTALMFAAESGNKKCVKYLVDNGANVNSTITGDFEKGRTALMFAAEKGNKECVEYLVDKGADVNSVVTGWLNKGKIALMFAVENENKECVEYLVDKGADINAINNNGCTPLMFAARSGNKECIEYLVDNGAAVNVATKDGKTALMSAAEKGRKECVEYLVDKGADVNSTITGNFEKGKTPLMFAAESGNKECIEYLVNKGANVNSIMTGFCEGRTALMFAAEKGNKECIEYLVDKGADVNSVMTGCQNKGKTALMFAAESGNKKCVKYLVDNGAAVNVATKDGKTALMSAAEKGRKECVEYLVDKGADVNSTITGNFEKGKTPLMFAAESGNKECIEYLVNKGANVNSIMTGFCEGRTALMFAAEKGNKECVEYLVNKGANVNSTITGDFEKGSTALMFAAEKGNKECVEYLVDNGADINAKEKHGWIALMFTARSGNKECIEYFVDKGADVNAKDPSGWTALMCAAKKGNKECVEYLVDKGADINSVMTEWQNKGKTALMSAAEKGRKECVEYLVDKGADVNSTMTGDFEKGKTPLMFAASNGHKECVEYLVDKGVDVNAATEEDRKTALMFAARGNKECVEYLVDNGADINAKEKHGWTALMVAAEKGSKECVEYLVNKGADINAATEDGMTALMFAVEKKNKNVSLLLLNQQNLNVDYVKQSFSADLFNTLVSYIHEDSQTIEYLLLKGKIDFFNLDYKKIASKLSSSFLLNNWLDIHNLNNKKYSSLHFAVLNPNSSVLEELLDKNDWDSILNLRNNAKFTFANSPLSLAIELNSLKHAKILLAYGSSPIYKHWFGNKNYLNENDELKYFVSNEMLIYLLKRGKVNKAFRVIPDKDKCHPYYKKIDLNNHDDEGRNVFHYLAMNCFDDTGISHFLERAKLLKCFDKKTSFKSLLLTYDIYGMLPIHYAIINSNSNFIKNLTSLENIKTKINILNKRELNKKTEGKNGERSLSIKDLIIKHAVSSDVIKLLVERLWCNVSKSDQIHNIIRGNKKDQIQKEEYERENQNKIEILAPYIEGGGSILAEDEDGNSILDIIVEQDNSELLQYLLNNPNIINIIKNYDELLLTAIELEKKECAELLYNSIDRTVNRDGKTQIELLKDKIEEREKKNKQPLLNEICESGKIEVLDIVIKIVKSIDEDKMLETDGRGNTFVHSTVMNDKIDGISKKKILTKLYKEHKEYINKIKDVKNKLGNNLMHCACGALNADMVTFFGQLYKEQIYKKNNDGNRPIDIFKDIPIIENTRLSRLGAIFAMLNLMNKENYEDKMSEAEIGEENSKLSESLHMLIKINDNSLNWLFEELTNEHKEIDINTKDKEGNTPLHLTFKMNNKAFAKILLKNKITKLLEKNKEQMVPLHYAKDKKILEIAIEESLKNGTKSRTLLNNQYEGGNTFLHNFSTKGKLNDIEIKKDIKINKDSTKNRDEIDSIEELVDHIVNNVFEDVKKEIEIEKKEIELSKIIRYLMDNGIDKNIPNIFGEKAINIADREELVLIKEELQKDPDTTNMQEREKAYEEKKRAEKESAEEEIEVMKILSGESPKKINDWLEGQKNRAIHILAKSGNINGIIQAIKNGVNIYLLNNEGKSAFEIATEIGYDTIFTELVKNGDVLKEFRTKEKDKDIETNAVNLALMCIGNTKYIDAVTEQLMKMDSKEMKKKMKHLKQNPLIQAIKNGDSYSLQKLLKVIKEKGIDITKEIKDEEGNSVFYHAIKEGERAHACFKVLLNHLTEERCFKNALFNNSDSIKRKGGESIIEIMLNKESPFYIKSTLKRLKELEDKMNVLEIYTFIDKEIAKNIDNLIENRRIEHISLILKYHSMEAIGSLMGRDGEGLNYGKAIYLAAEHKEKEVVGVFISSFIQFKTRSDIRKQKIKGYVKEIIDIAVTAAGSLVGSGDKASNLLNKATGERIKSQKTDKDLFDLASKGTKYANQSLLKGEINENQFENIRYIEDVYREGRWAENIELIPEERTIKYFIKIGDMLKEPLREEVEEAIRNKNTFSKIKKSFNLAKIKVKEELEMNQEKIMDIFVKTKCKNIGDIEYEEIQEKYKEKIEDLKKECLDKLDEFEDKRQEYIEKTEILKQFIEDKKKGKEKISWKEIDKDIIKESYGQMIKTREDLKEKVYRYISLTTKEGVINFCTIQIPK